MSISNVFFCEKCCKTMGAEQFYGSNNLEKYPEGKLRQCKKCITMHVDNFDADTYLWIIQECDIPYIQKEWMDLLEKYGKDRTKLTGVSILGRYISKMKLKQWKDYRWKDNEFLEELEKTKIEQTMKRQGYDAQEIATAIMQASAHIPEGELAPPPPPPTVVNEEAQEDYFSQGTEIDIDLTDEDRTYLRLKWGKTYKPDEWVRLEQLYNEMMESYDIQSAGHIDTLKLVCKTSLKANQLLDIGDVEGAQKMIKMYDGLMKSGKFTAAQNKAEQGEYVDSISELVAICEKDGFIPRYYVDGPQDKVDYVIQDMQDYTNNLIREEMHLAELIERAVKQIEQDREAEQQIEAYDDESDEEAFARDLFAPEADMTYDEEAYNEFENFLDDDRSYDEALLDSLDEDN